MDAITDIVDVADNWISGFQGTTRDFNVVYRMIELMDSAAMTGALERVKDVKAVGDIQ